MTWKQLPKNSPFHLNGETLLYGQPGRYYVYVYNPLTLKIRRYPFSCEFWYEEVGVYLRADPMRMTVDQLGHRFNVAKQQGRLKRHMGELDGS